jgi:hypothetical protein
MINHSSDEPIYLIFKILAFITFIFYLVISVFYLKLKIKPLRKDNIEWRFDNN